MEELITLNPRDYIRFAAYIRETMGLETNIYLIYFAMLFMDEDDDKDNKLDSWVNNFHSMSFHERVDSYDESCHWLNVLYDNPIEQIKCPYGNQIKKYKSDIEIEEVFKEDDHIKISI